MAEGVVVGWPGVGVLVVCARQKPTPATIVGASPCPGATDNAEGGGGIIGTRTVAAGYIKGKSIRICSLYGSYYSSIFVRRTLWPLGVNHTLVVYVVYETFE